MPLLSTRFTFVRSAGQLSVARSIACSALAVALASACNRGEHEVSPAPSAAPVVETPTAPSSSVPPVVPAPSASPKPEPTTSTACAIDADCRTFSDSCGGCSCRPLAKTSVDPKCTGKRTSCLVDPCIGQRVMCRKGNCVIGDPGDAATADAKSAAKDAGSSDASSKGADSAGSAPGTASKTADGAARD